MKILQWFKLNLIFSTLCLVLPLLYPGAQMTGPVIGRLQNLPVLNGLPLSVMRYRSSGENNGSLGTSAILKEQSFSAETFSVPIGFRFKKVPFKKEMVSTKIHNDNTNDLYKEFLGR